MLRGRWTRSFVLVAVLAAAACGQEEQPAPAPEPTPGAVAQPANPPPPPEPVVPDVKPPGPGDGGIQVPPPGPGAPLTIRVKEHTDRIRTLANEASALLKQLDKEAGDVSQKAATLKPGDNASVRQMEGQSRQFAAKAAELHQKLEELQKLVNLVERETDKLKNRATP